jgi:hypothetical protein
MTSEPGLRHCLCRTSRLWRRRGGRRLLGRCRDSGLFEKRTLANFIGGATDDFVSGFERTADFG